MPYYKDINNGLHWLDNPAFSYLLPASCVQISAAAADAIRSANASNPAALANITPRQIRMALTQAGLRTVVETAVAAGSQDLKDWWEFSTYFERTHPQVVAMAAALGVSDAQLDSLWALGATL